MTDLTMIEQRTTIERLVDDLMELAGHITLPMADVHAILQTRVSPMSRDAHVSEEKLWDALKVAWAEKFDDVCPECGSTGVHLMTYCNHLHCIGCGTALNKEHAECWVPPAAIRAEQDDEYGTALALIENKAVWVRVGDGGDYHPDDYYPFADAWDAGYYIGEHCGMPEVDVDSILWVAAGVHLPPRYVGMNYISCYIGDSSANWRKELNEDERGAWTRGLMEGISEYLECPFEFF